MKFLAHLEEWLITFLLEARALFAAISGSSRAIVLIMPSILFPIAMALGIDPVHFGISMAICMVTRPVRSNR